MSLNLSTLFQLQSALFVFKIGFLILLMLFFAFLVVLLKQIHTMNQLITQPRLFPILQFVTLTLFAITAILFIGILTFL